ncbi:hypothetical protein D3C73_952250 [compost metagenome]
MEHEGAALSTPANTDALQQVSKCRIIAHVAADAVGIDTLEQSRVNADLQTTLLAEGNQRRRQRLSRDVEARARDRCGGLSERQGLRSNCAAKPQQAGRRAFFQAQQARARNTGEAVKGVCHAKIPAPAKSGQSMNTNTSQLLRAGQKTG